MSHYSTKSPPTILHISHIDHDSLDIWDNRVIPGFIESKDHPLASTFYHSENTACMEQVGLHPVSF